MNPALHREAQFQVSACFEMWKLPLWKVFSRNWEQHQEHLKVNQWTIKCVSCAISTLAAAVYCLYFMLYTHALAVWWTSWSCWPVLKAVFSFHWQLNMLLWQHPSVRCFISLHAGEDSPRLQYCITSIQHTPAPEELWHVNPHFFRFKYILYNFHNIHSSSY